ncbi:hypothetical protein NST08_04520 [Paenibacillus sp. FSL K6-1566]|uniref:hypothetical protein n=1 Tax=Paenibacillus TaxID=44249 RepID=UPI00203E078E|nr:hypothetical protein [Paenibacillus lactis]MCM3494596.1 hypothetical protein [Paenibacillus lactis]
MKRLPLICTLCIPAQRPDGRFHFPQHHLGHIADRCAQVGQHRKRVEIPDAGQILGADVRCGIESATDHRHVSDGRFGSLLEQQLHMRNIQVLQQTVLPLFHQLRHIIGAVVIHRIPRSSEQRGRQIRTPFALVRRAERIFQRFDHMSRIADLQPPKRHLRLASALGIRYVKHMAQAQVVAPIFDQGNPFCAALHPAIQPLVPNFNRRAGRRVRTLCVDQQLILKRIFIVPGRRPQKIRPAVRLIRHRASRAGSQFDDALQLGCHESTSLTET